MLPALTHCGCKRQIILFLSPATDESAVSGTQYMTLLPVQKLSHGNAGNSAQLAFLTDVLKRVSARLIDCKRYLINSLIN